MYTFQDGEAFLQWVRDEQKTWLELAKQQRGTSQRYLDVLDAIIQKGAPRNTFDDDLWRDAVLYLQRLYSRGLIHHLSPKGRVVVGLLDKKLPIAAGAAWAYFCRVPIEHIEQPETYRGVFAAVAYESGYPVGSDAAAPGFEALMHQMSQWSDSARVAIGSEHSESIKSRKSSEDAVSRMRAELGAFRAKIENDLEETRKKSTATLDSIVAGSTSRYDEILASSKAELTAITKTYDDKLALQASVSYWTSKRNSHRLWSKLFGGAFILALLICGWGLFVFVKDLVPAEATRDKAPIVRLVESIVVVTFVVWFIRTIARLFLVHLHLAEDSSERVVMINTYLALLRESAGVKDNDRELILQALFRRASTGIVKDDANPPFLLGLLQKRDHGDK